MSERDAVLFANEAFYAAFARRDAAAMDEVWTREAAVSCIHPGWDALYGRDDVMRSWRAILGSAGAPTIRCCAPRVLFYGELAAVICFEEIGGTYLIATNLFLHEGGLWKMVHHHAGPTQGVPPEDDPEEEPPPVN